MRLAAPQYPGWRLRVRVDPVDRLYRSVGIFSSPCGLCAARPVAVRRTWRLRAVRGLAALRLATLDFVTVPMEPGVYVVVQR